MESKDLKNSEIELTGAPIEPETTNDHDVVEAPAQSNDAAEVGEAPAENAISENTPEPVAEAEVSEPETTENQEVITSETVSVIEQEEGETPTAPEEVAPLPETGQALASDEAPEEVTVETPEVQTVAEEEVIDTQEVIEEIALGKEIETEEVDEIEEQSNRRAKFIDYASLNEPELIEALRAILEKDDFEYFRDDVEAIKVNFFKLYRANIDAQKTAFAETGGNVEEFKAEPDDNELELRNLLKIYQERKNEQSKRSEEIKEENLAKKYEIIEEIKALINNKESINRTFHEFRDLQNRWREIGSVPQSKLKDLWDTYHHHVENFYDFIKINKELRDLDLKKNLEAKIEICEKAEELLVEPSIIKAFNVLQKYHEQWREVGPVPRDKKDELWERFKAATSIVNKKHQDFFENRKNEQKRNLDAKIALCEKVEEISNSVTEAHRDWDEKSKEVAELQKVWRTIGFAPKKDNNKIYERFRTASDKFFNQKRKFYNQNKEEQQNNLQLKTDLCLQAEALKDSTEWKKTADEFIVIQKAWKEIGPVPRKFSDVIWKRFRSACDYFFENKAKHFSSIDTEQTENLRLKRELLAEAKQFTLSGDDNADLDKLKEFQRRFTDIGHVPFKEKDAIQNEFRDAVNKHFDALRVDEKRRNLMKFKNKVANSTTTGKGQGKMRFEREKYITKLIQMETDLALLDNNIGFFANTKNASALLSDLNQKIANTKEKIEFLKEKIRIMDSMEDEE